MTNLTAEQKHMLAKVYRESVREALFAYFGEAWRFYSSEPAGRSVYDPIPQQALDWIEHCAPSLPPEDKVRQRYETRAPWPFQP
jgi:hypothetical protein